MYLTLLLLSIVGMVTLICVLVFIIYKILRDKKNGYSWFSLILIVFFLGLAIWQSLTFLT
ncbi:hypothetical protein JCM9157_4806 [Halalkalibacter akibai JCM 9157]|uniref:Uncharacterized protein n=1 Tax=Halalkalibacter akibai (strain ATCC 43226 / DSM 21942 / CIP 109018 / JCM 9157 / 1139) TaxID=1236973 RepID=W4QZK7_HALA3|nr:hypothetical protein JCM9157_4806 [Halalkalibacter akibai JCM 9157]